MMITNMIPLCLFLNFSIFSEFFYFANCKAELSSILNENF